MLSSYFMLFLGLWIVLTLFLVLVVTIYRTRTGQSVDGVDIAYGSLFIGAALALGICFILYSLRMIL